MFLIEEFKNYLKINIDAENTRINYRSRVNCFFSMYNDFTQENINAYLANQLDAGKSKSWFNQTLTALRCYEKMIGEHLVYPKYKKIGKTERDFLTEKELNEILPYMTRLFETKGKFYTLVLKLLFYTGVRQDELCKLETESIDFDKQIFIVKGPKDRDDKIVPFPKHLIPEMKQFLQIEKNKAYPITQCTMDYIFNHLNTELGYKKYLTSRMLRHSYAKYILSLGVPVEKLQILMGHSNIQTTMIYAQPRREDALNAYFEKINS